MSGPHFATAVLIQGKQDPWEIFNVGLQQLLFYDGRDTSPLAIRTREGEDDQGTGRRYICTDPHENLPAVLGSHYRPHGDLFTEQEAQSEASRCVKPGCNDHRTLPCHVIVGFATDIRYIDERQWNAGNLHAGMVWALGGYLDSKKIPWVWQDNISGSSHTGYGDLEFLPKAVDNVRNGFNPSLGSAISQAILRSLGLAPGDQ